MAVTPATNGETTMYDYPLDDDDLYPLDLDGFPEHEDAYERDADGEPIEW